MTSEEVKISIGVDNSALSSGLRDSESKIQNSFRKSISNIKGLVGSLRGGLLLGGILNAPAIVDGLLGQLSNSKKRLEEIATDWMDIFTGAGLDSQKKLERAELDRISKVKAENKNRWDEEAERAKELAEYITKRDADQFKKGSDIIRDNNRRKDEANKRQSTQEDLIFAEQALFFEKERGTILSIAEAEKKVLDIKDDILSQEKAITEEKQKQFQLNSTPTSALPMLQQYQAGEAQFTNVDELADAWGNGSQFQDEAQRIKQLEGFAKYNRSGFRDSNVNLAKTQEEEIVNLKAFLSEQGAIAENPVVAQLKSLGVMFEKGTAIVKVTGTD